MLQYLVKNFKLLIMFFIIILMFQKAIKRRSKLVQTELCVICSVRLTNCRTVQCGHSFCYRCLSKWGRRKGNCPLCRKEIRQIYYKNKVISPSYLAEFDQRVIYDSEELNQILQDNQRINSQNNVALEPSLGLSIPVGYFTYPYLFYVIPFTN